jgi:hypothetical protein
VNRHSDGMTARYIPIINASPALTGRCATTAGLSQTQVVTCGNADVRWAATSQTYEQHCVVSTDMESMRWPL